MGHVPAGFQINSFGAFFDAAHQTTPTTPLVQQSLQEGLHVVTVKFSMTGTFSFATASQLPQAAPLQLELDGQKYDPLPLDLTGENIEYVFRIGYVNNAKLRLTFCVATLSIVSGATLITGSVTDEWVSRE